MTNEYNNLIKEKRIIDLKINEIRDFIKSKQNNTSSFKKVIYFAYFL